MTKEQFYHQCELNGLILNEVQKKQLDQYLYLLQETNKVMNLTGITEENEVYEKHYYDCLLASYHLDFENRSLVDVGAGAGFPGLEYAICYPNLNVTLVEPLTKRCNFLSKVKEDLKLNNVIIINERSEDFVKNARGKYDYATARAVAKLNILLEIITPLLKINGLFIALKGRQGEEELIEASNAIKLLNLKVIDVKKTKLLTVEDERVNIYIRLINTISPKYPRAYSQIKKKPL